MMMASSSSTSTKPSPPNIVPVPYALYVCVVLNMITHILSIFFAFLCFRNFGKGLKERVFNNRADKLLQRCC